MIRHLVALALLASVSVSAAQVDPWQRVMDLATGETVAVVVKGTDTITGHVVRADPQALYLVRGRVGDPHQPVNAIARDDVEVVTWEERELGGGSICTGRAFKGGFWGWLGGTFVGMAIGAAASGTEKGVGIGGWIGGISGAIVGSRLLRCRTIRHQIYRRS
jgi:hypothetical protein